MMEIQNGTAAFSPSDLGNFLACGHLINLELLAKKGELAKVYSQDPMLLLMRERGIEFEKLYVEYLKTEKRLSVCDLSGKSFDATVEAMRTGHDVIVQARLKDGAWRGYADILIKIDQPSNLGKWSYQVQDTKLSQNTRNSAILQLCFYSEVIGKIQGFTPEIMKIVKPGEPFKEEEFRYDDFKAYFKLVQKSLEYAVASPQQTYPDPVEHCSICNWWKHCKDTRRNDDHLSLVAGIQSSQVLELQDQKISTLGQFAEATTLKKPRRGNLESLKKKQDQAKIQAKGRTNNLLEYEILPIPVHSDDKSHFKKESEHGFNILPQPSDGDIYFDFEGDAFYEGGGLEYLFGYIYKEKNEWIYKKEWARNRLEEKRAFQNFMTFAMRRFLEFPGMCIYHYAPKEPTSFKRLMRVHGCHEDDVNKLLRGLRFVDLHTVSKRALIASVERYSLKDLEQLPKYTREVPLEQASLARRQVELALNSGDVKCITDKQLEIVNGYNEDDCRATMALHQWIELRRKEYEENGADLRRLQTNDGELEETKKKDREEIRVLFDQLVNDLPADRAVWNDDHRAKWLLANLLYYFQREFDSALWEYYLTINKDDEDLIDDRKAIVGLTFVESLPVKKKNETPVEIYTFKEQEVDFKSGEQIRDIISGKGIGSVVLVSEEEQIIHIKRKKDSIEIRPEKIATFPTNTTDKLFKSLKKFAEAVIERGLGDQGLFLAGADLLRKSRPRFTMPVGGRLSDHAEDLVQSAIELAKLLDNSTLALQGPPGTGKTHTGAEIIVALAKEKKRIGVTAVSHKAYQNLLLKVNERAAVQGISIKLSYKAKDGSEPVIGLNQLDEKDRDAFKDALDQGQVVGGTAWLWAADNAEGQLDYLFVDEAGQMSLAYVLAASRSAKNIVLLGDPNQLEQPQKGTHPEGSDVAALEHLLDGHKTMPDDRGLFMHTTRRLHPSICEFTSEQFYEGKLRSLPGLESQVITGITKFKGSGLFYVPVRHQGNQTKSLEEIDAIAKIVENLTALGEYKSKRITASDILIVAPYNSQVNALKLRLPQLKIGTVDKFQGQEAPVVIYSMTASTAEDAPRGMRFLYDPNRFNVATSRALSICILVASPKLLEPDCCTIDQMKWANVLCRYKEMAREIHL